MNQNHSDFLLLKDSRHLSFWYFSLVYIKFKGQKELMSFLKDWRNQCSVYNVVLLLFIQFHFPDTTESDIHYSFCEIQITMVPSNLRQSIDNCRTHWEVMEAVSMLLESPVVNFSNPISERLKVSERRLT